MNLRLLLLSFCPLLFSCLSSNAQQEQEARLWLTTPDRAAVVALQSTSLHFSSKVGGQPVLTVDDAQHFQTMDGFGFALTGGSAQLLMRMSAARVLRRVRKVFREVHRGDALGGDHD